MIVIGFCKNLPLDPLPVRNPWTIWAQKSTQSPTLKDVEICQDIKFRICQANWFFYLIMMMFMLVMSMVSPHLNFVCYFNSIRYFSCLLFVKALFANQQFSYLSLIEEHSPMHESGDIDTGKKNTPDDFVRFVNCWCCKNSFQKKLIIIVIKRE